MKKILLMMVALLAMTLFITGSAKADFVDFASTSPDGLISFSGGNFTFTHSTFDFSVTHSGPFDTLHGFSGTIGGTYAIGTVGPGGIGEIANVTSVGLPGTNVFTINDGLTPFTATVNWIQITTSTNGIFGGLNPEASMNLTNFSYAGSNPELLALLADLQGTGTVSWQFATTGFDLNALRATTNPITTSYSGSISAVPLPPTALLLGSGILGLLALGWRRKREV